MTTDQQVAAVARTWVDVPFRHQGRSRRGVDCIGLLFGVLQDIDDGSAAAWAEAVRLAPDYARMPAAGRLYTEVARYCHPALGADIPGTGTLVLLTSAASLEMTVRHCAIGVGRGIIHADSRIGHVTEFPFGTHLAEFVHSVWRLPGVQYE